MYKVCNLEAKLYLANRPYILDWFGKWINKILVHLIPKSLTKSAYFPFFLHLELVLIVVTSDHSILKKRIVFIL